MWIFLIVVLVILSVISTYKIGFKNYNFKTIIKSIKHDKTSLFMSLGIKIGVGSIVATASSIIIGGYESVIWMLLFSLITSSLIYVEAYLGKKYKSKYKDENIGGFFHIISKTYKSKCLSYLSLFLLILSYSFIFQMIQSNTISSIINVNYGVNKNIICISFIILLLIMFKFKIKDIIDLLNKIVPLMCVIFILISCYGIISNIDLLIMNIKNLNLFNDVSILTGLIIGIKRSIFMNETLIGTTSVSSGIDCNDIEKSATIQVLGSYFISFIITLLITFLLIIYGNTNITDYNLLVSNTFYFTTGRIGIFVLSILIILFGITTILSGYYIGKINLSYLTGSRKINMIFNIMFFIFIVISVYVKSELIWNYLDILLFIMILLNCYSIIKLIGSENFDRK